MTFDLLKLPLWLIVIILAIILSLFVYAVFTGRNVDFWGFRIGEKKDEKPILEPSAVKENDDPEKKEEVGKSTDEALYEKRRIRLKLGDPVDLYRPGEEKIILRGIEKKENQTVYKSGEVDFAKIEFKNFGVLEASKGVYSDQEYGTYWLPYFDEDNIAGHSVFKLYQGYLSDHYSATFIWIENINSHTREVDIIYVKIKAIKP